MSVDDFVSDLSAHADATGRPALRSIIGRLCRPVRFRTTGRPGVGRRTLMAALSDADLTAVDARADGDADVDVVVIAEAAKPEDRQLAAAARAPVVIALNKTDLLGAAAAARVRLIRQHTGLPVFGVSALFATAVLDDGLFDAVRALATDPPDLRSVDAFCAAPHRVDAATRARLLDTVDLSGIAVAVDAVRAGADSAGVAAQLRGSSAVDEVRSAVLAAAAPARYLRLCDALTELRTLAAGTADQRLDAILTGDAAALAAMETALAVVRADGLAAHAGDPVRWRRYRRGPVNALHRRCAADIERGALRLGAP
ncbi:hypothetical protein L2K20_06410 [Mycobacterium sp. MBM]|nr:hypothetical protein [Mycobacterium sp. MBM]